MDKAILSRLADPTEGFGEKPSKKTAPLKVFVLVAVQFLIAADAVVAAIRLGAKGMSNWLVFPLVLSSLLLVASATYAIARRKRETAQATHNNSFAEKQW